MALGRKWTELRVSYLYQAFFWRPKTQASLVFIDPNFQTIAARATHSRFLDIITATVFASAFSFLETSWIEQRQAQQAGAQV